MDQGASKGLLENHEVLAILKKKVFFFNEKTVFTTFDAPLSDNAKPVYTFHSIDPKEVSVQRVQDGEWWDKDEEESNDLYNFNKEINGLSPKVNDFDSLRKTVFTSKEKDF